jgi:hypothetical protein
MTFGPIPATRLPWTRFTGPPRNGPEVSGFLIVALAPVVGFGFPPQPYATENPAFHLTVFVYSLEEKGTNRNGKHLTGSEMSEVCLEEKKKWVRYFPSVFMLTRFGSGLSYTLHPIFTQNRNFNPWPRCGTWLGLGKKADLGIVVSLHHFIVFSVCC